MKKVIGISFGRKMQNTEILVKEALMGAEEMGADVGFIRMEDLDIRPCTGCIACVRSLETGGKGECVIKDDLHFVEEQILDSDGVVFGSPVYVLTPTGLFKTVCDRFGPAHDFAFRMETNKKKIAEGKSGNELIDERAFKTRYAGMISVGGAKTHHWVSLGLPLLNLFAFPQQLTVIDQMEAIDMVSHANVLLHPPYIERARKMGRNIGASMGKKPEDVPWMGDEEGTCPVCHSNLLVVTGKNPVECPVCGIFGELKIDDGRISVTFTEEEKTRSRMHYEGKLEHYLELTQPPESVKQFRAENVKRLPGLMEKYKGYRELKFK